MRIEPFKSEHLQALILQPAQACIQGALADTNYHEELARHEAYTAFDGERIVACAGVVKLWPGRVQAWALIANDIGPLVMREVHFAVKRFLDTHRGIRIEANVVRDFPNGARWMRALGFDLETPDGMKQFLPDGETADMWAMV